MMRAPSARGVRVSTRCFVWLYSDIVLLSVSPGCVRQTPECAAWLVGWYILTLISNPCANFCGGLEGGLARTRLGASISNVVKSYEMANRSSRSGAKP